MYWENVQRIYMRPEPQGERTKVVSRRSPSAPPCLYNRAMYRLKLACQCVAAILVCVAASSVATAQSGFSKLQKAVAQTMVGQRGVAVVLDVHTGRVLAAYHANVAARLVVHPGSSIKPFTLLALLEAGTVDANTALVCKRPLTIGGHRLDCPHPDTAEPLGPAAALAYSCNSYFTRVAKIGRA